MKEEFIKDLTKQVGILIKMPKEELDALADELYASWKLIRSLALFAECKSIPK